MHIIAGLGLIILSFGLISFALQSLPGGLGGSVFSALAISSSEEAFTGAFAVEEGGVYEPAPVRGRTAPNVFSIVPSPSNSRLLLAATDQGLLMSRDRGQMWNTFTDLEGNIDGTTQVYAVAFSPTNTSDVYVSAFRNGRGVVYLARDNFFTFEPILELKGEAVYDIAVFGSTLYLGLSDGRLMVYSRTDDTFRVVRAFGAPIRHLESLSGRFPLYIVVGSTRLVRYDGAQFSEVASFTSFGALSDLAVHPSNASLLYGATRQGLIRSSDGGRTWRVITTIPSDEERIDSVFVSHSGVLYAGNSRLYYSTDRGTRWHVTNAFWDDREISTITAISDTIILGTTE